MPRPLSLPALALACVSGCKPDPTTFGPSGDGPGAPETAERYCELAMTLAEGYSLDECITRAASELERDDFPPEDRWGLLATIAQSYQIRALQVGVEQPEQREAAMERALEYHRLAAEASRDDLLFRLLSLAAAAAILWELERDQQAHLATQLFFDEVNDYPIMLNPLREGEFGRSMLDDAVAQLALAMTPRRPVEGLRLLERVRANPLWRAWIPPTCAQLDCAQGCEHIEDCDALDEAVEEFAKISLDLHLDWFDVALELSWERAVTFWDQVASAHRIVWAHAAFEPLRKRPLERIEAPPGTAYVYLAGTSTVSLLPGREHPLVTQTPVELFSPERIRGLIGGRGLLELEYARDLAQAQLEASRPPPDPLDDEAFDEFYDASETIELDYYKDTLALVIDSPEELGLEQILDLLSDCADGLRSDRFAERPAASPLPELHSRLRRLLYQRLPEHVAAADAILAAPLAAQLHAADVQRLVVVPDRRLDLLPLAALPSWSSFDVAVSESITGHQLRAERWRDPVASTRAIANPSGDMPCAEVIARAQVRDPDLRVLGEDASFGGSFEALSLIDRDSHTLLLAAHGRPTSSSYRIDRPQVLELGANELSFEQLLGAPLHNTHLVVLLACGSAKLGQWGGPKLSRSLVGALQVAGAHDIVGGLWDIDEIASSFIVARLLRNVEAGQPVDAALREAQRWIQASTRAELEAFWSQLEAASDSDEVEARCRTEMDALLGEHQDTRPFEHPYYWSGLVAYR